MAHRLLFVTDVKLHALNQGIWVRVSNLLMGCARGHSVTLIAPAPDSTYERARIESHCEQVLWLGEQTVTGARNRAATWLQAFRAAPGIKSPWNVRRYWDFAAALRMLDMGSFDIIWAQRPHIALQEL